MAKTELMGYVFFLITGIVLLYLGIQYLFDTENFIQKLINFKRLDERSIQYRYLKNKSNMVYHKMTGVGYLLGGLLFIILPVLKFLKYIH